MKLQLSTIFVTLLSIGCSTPSPTPDAPPNPDQPATQTAEIDSPKESEARERLAKFLTARWSLDREHTLPLVTREDRENVWTFAFEPPAKDALPEGLELAPLYEWKIETLDITGDNATAVVEVLVPTFMEVATWELSLQELVNPTPRTYEEFEAANTRAVALLPKTVPPRHVVHMTYRMVREDGEWRVKMGWKHFPSEAPGPEQVLPSTDAFEGSEKWWIDVAWRMSPSTLSSRQENLYRDIRRAEGFVKSRHYEEAILRYSELEENHPGSELISSRLEAVKRAKKWWAETVARANLSIQPRYRSVDGKSILVVSVENRGSSNLHEIRFEILTTFEDPMSSKTATSLASQFRVEQLEAGDATTVRAEVESPGVYPNAESPPPLDLTQAEIDRVRLTDLTFAGSKTEQPFPSSEEFELHVWDVLTEGVTARAAWRIHREILLVRSDLLACSGWPELPFFARIHVNAAGSISAVRLSKGSNDFAACIESSVKSIELPAARPARVIVQLIPPEFLAGDAGPGTSRP